MTIDSDVDQNTKLLSFFTFITKMHIFMVILHHIGGEQFSMILQVFLVLNGPKRWQFCVLINARANVHIFRVIKSFISSIDLILGHPV